MTRFRPPHSRPRAPRRGIVLLEALIAILIFALGVLGVVGLQGSMVRAQSAAKFRADAAYLANELTSSIWTDIPNIAKYDTASGKCKDYTRCADWQDKVNNLLPGAKSTVKADSTGSIEISIEWNVPEEGKHVYQTTALVQSAG